MATNLQTERLRGLSPQGDDTWQGGAVQLPTEVLNDDGTRFVPSMCMWVSTRTGRVGVNPIDAGRVTPPTVVQAMVDFASGAAGGQRPGRLEVTDATYAAALREVVEPLGITVAVVDRLPAVDALAEQLFQSMPALFGSDGPGEGPPALLDDPAVTPKRVGRFAEAAKVFYEAAPWRHFGPTDLIAVVAPRVAKPLRFINVMGGGGEQFGLAFFPSEAAFSKMLKGDPRKYADKHPMVSVTFDTDDMLPPGDVEAWKAHGWPVAKRGRKPFYPMPATFARGTWSRPAAAELATMEGLLRALALVTPANLAAGVWSIHVNTADGEVKYEFEATIKSNDAPAGSSLRGPFGRLLGKLFGGGQSEADRLVDAAWDAGDSGGAIDLAFRALSIDPDAADAYVILANGAPTGAAAIQFLRQGVAAGERKLGATFFKKNTGTFWGMMQTRPYMRAMAGLANELHERGDLDEAVSIWDRLLELNPNDNQGMRHLLALALLQLGRDADVTALLGRYRGDGSMPFMYARALLRFRADGDGPAANGALVEAVGSNPHVVPYLTGRKRTPRDLPETYAVGAKSEADAFAKALVPAWRATPGAVDWVKAHTPGRSAAQRPKPRGRPSKPRGMWLPRDSKPPTGL